MQNRTDSFQPPPTGYRHLFGAPALQKKKTRRQRIEAKSIAKLTPGDLTYLEVRDILDAHGNVDEVLNAAADHIAQNERRARGAGR